MAACGEFTPNEALSIGRLTSKLASPTSIQLVPEWFGDSAAEIKHLQLFHQMERNNYIQQIKNTELTGTSFRRFFD